MKEVVNGEEVGKATARLKQDMELWTEQIKWLEDEVVGVKRDDWTSESSQPLVLIPLQTVTAAWLNLPFQGFHKTLSC